MVPVIFDTDLSEIWCQSQSQVYSECNFLREFLRGYNFSIIESHAYRNSNQTLGTEVHIHVHGDLIRTVAVENYASGMGS